MGITLTERDHSTGASQVTVLEQLKALKDPAVWRYSQYYSIVFGGYVALALWMTKYYISEYGFDIQVAALLAAGFSIPGGLLRAIGGWFSDKYGAHSVTWWVLWVGLVCLFFLSYPQSDFTIHTVSGPKTFHIGLNPTVFTIIMFTMGISFAIGKASVFKYIADDYPHNIGVVSGIVGLAGGMGGLSLPILFGALVDPDRSALVGVHADVRYRLGVPDVDVLRRSAPTERRQERPARRARTDGA